MDRNGHPVGCLFRLGNRVDTGGVAACALGVLVRVVPNLGTGVVPGKGRVWLPGGGRHVGCFVPPLSCAKMCAFTQSDTPISEGRIRCYLIIAGNLRWQPIGPDAGRRSLWAVIRSAVSATHLRCGLGRLRTVHGQSRQDGAASQRPHAPVSAGEQPFETLQRVARKASMNRAGKPLTARAMEF